MSFETVVGLEAHAELKTNSKIFSSAPAHSGAGPNSNINVVNWNYPSVLPVMNKGALEFGVKATLALNYEISKGTHFGCKNYFYPDNPKAYQISQFDQSVGHDGWIEIEVEGKRKKIRIERVRLGEDAGKNIHGTDGYSYINSNRQGTPLIEIVSEADMRSPEEAYAYLEALHSIIRSTEVSDAKVEGGSIRCDTNISLCPCGREELDAKAELKNLSSMNFVKRSLAYEEKHQARALLSDGEIQQETRRLDKATSTTLLMRVKEGSSDCRYFPEPDVPRFSVDDEWVEKVRASLPEMLTSRHARCISELRLLGYGTMVLTLTKEMSDFFEVTLTDGAGAKQTSNWLMDEISAYLSSKKVELTDTKLAPENLAGMITLINDGTINSKITEKVFKELVENGRDAKEAIEAKGLIQLFNPAQLLPMINEVSDNNQQSIDDFKNGKDRAVGFLVGQIMKATRRQTDPSVVNKLL